MARSYHVDIARFAANAEHKWIDNLLSHFDLVGVERARQGAARRIADVGIYNIALVRVLTRKGGMATSTAIEVAERLLAGDSDVAEIGDGLELRLDRAAFQRVVDLRIADAVESIVPARRGRPPKRSSNARHPKGE